MKKNDWINLTMILIFYLLLLFFLKNNIFHYKFDKNILKNYFLSQDIPHGVAGKRLFLSDAQVYEAVGYLYAQGADPADFNFEHPPLIKYFFGFSTMILGNPYIAQILLGIAFLSIFYFFGLKLYKNSRISLLACFLICIDPLFLDLSSSLLLDLGQAVFLIFYIISMLYYEDDYLMQGMSLGLSAGTKFWVTPLFFLCFLTIFRLYKRKFVLKYYLYHLLTSIMVFTFLYIKTIYDRGGNFNIFFHILKILKYRLHHNVTSLPGSSIILFMTGFLKEWWGRHEFIRQELWSFIWPISLIIVTLKGLNQVVRRKISRETVVNLIPVSYLFYLGVQATLPRYFMAILPFCYLGLAFTIYTKIAGKLKIRHQKNNRGYVGNSLNQISAKIFSAFSLKIV